MASFPWHEQTSGPRLPARYFVHSRTLSFCKLLEPAREAGLTGHFDSLLDVIPALEASNDCSMFQNSFFAVGPFGLYEATFVPCKPAEDMQVGDGADGFQLGLGKWAVPEHWAVCRGQQVFHTGISHKEMLTLRTQFIQAFSHVAANVGRSISSPQAQQGVPAFAENSQVFVDRGDGPRGDGGGNDVVDVDGRGDDSMAYMSTGIEYGAKEGNVSFDGSGTATASMTVRTSSSAPHIPGHVAHVGAGEGGGAPTRVEGMSDKEVTAETMPIEAATLGVDVGKPGGVSSGMGLQAPGFQSSVDDMLQDVPATVVDTIEGVEAVVGTEVGNRTGNVGFPTVAVYGGGEKDDKICTMGVTEGIAGTKITGNGSPPQKINAMTGGSSSTTKEDENGGAGKAFKKTTLPAPTRSEIVIRNRISAQRSNEKRRRKIEATKSELAYLKVTYLPQLEHKRGSLLNENQTLRLQFMEKYHEGDITSFF